MKSHQADTGRTFRVSGVINGTSGAPYKGSGFTSTKQGTGSYFVRIPNAKSIVSVVCNGSSTQWIGSTPQPPGNWFSIACYGSTGASVDVDVNFTAECILQT